jgi:uncharacterized Zn finger protein (UPF0148 family)
MAERIIHCTVCGKESPDGDIICTHCQALIRGEAVASQHEARKEAERVLHKEGSGTISDKPTHH